MLLLGSELIFANLAPGSGLFFEPGKRRDPSRALMPVTKYVLEIKKKCKKQTCRELNSLHLAERNIIKNQVNILEKNP